MLRSTQSQDFQAKLVLLSFSRLGNHQSNPHLRSIDGVQNLSSQDQSLRFIHLVWIFSGLSSRLHQGFPFKEHMNSHKSALNLKLHWVTTSTYQSYSVPTGLPPTILIPYQSPTYHSRLVPTILTKNSHPPFSTTHLPFFISLLQIEGSGSLKTHQEKHTES